MKKKKRKKLSLVISSCGKKISGSKTREDFEAEQAADYRRKLRNTLKQENKDSKWLQEIEWLLTKLRRSEIVQQARFFGADIQEK